MTSFKKDKNYLFVYGTLRKDPSNKMYQTLANNAFFVGKGTFKGILYDLGEYPGAVPSRKPSDIVIGEVYSLHDQDRVLKILDEYEGCCPEESKPPEFRRERIDISLENGENVQAWIYIYNRSTKGLKVIPSGDYLREKGQHKAR